MIERTPASTGSLVDCRFPCRVIDVQPGTNAAIKTTAMNPPDSAPWRKPKPKSTTKTKLTPRSIARAKAAAKRAGRRYPNLVDNMRAAREQREADAGKAGKTRKSARPD